jgi:predicted metalloprotease with PDZ domain
LKSASRIVFVILLLVIARPVSATIRYRISLKNPEQHFFRVSMEIPVNESDRDIIVAIPVWNALYQVRDFAYRVYNVRATNSSSPSDFLSIQKLDKQTWKVSLSAGSPSHSAIVTYEIAWNDPGPFNSQLDADHAFVNFAEVLMYLPNKRAEDTSVEFDDVPSGWHVAAELPGTPDSNSFSAASYDALVDAPAELGAFDEFAFDEAGAHFRVVVTGKGWRSDRLETDFHRIVNYEIGMMSGPPFRAYTFFINLGTYQEVGGGGMEHSNCTAISAPSVESAATIAAHEFFHAWNVKRIRPQTLEPVDFTREMYTRALWFAEGVTSTYGAYTLERTGLWDKNQFYGDLAEQISELDSRPAHTWQSVEESSLDAWLEKYDDYRQPDRSISYYNKGQLVGVLLDLAIRDATDNHKSLDDVMRRMNDVYAKQGRFYDDSNAVQAIAEEIAGVKFDDFFRRYIAGTDDIPYQDFFHAAGLDLKIETVKAAEVGFWTIGHGPGMPVVVSQVAPGTSAEAAGLKSGDTVVAINGQAVARNLQAWARDRSPGEKIRVTVRRDDKNVDVTFPLGRIDSRKFSVVETSSATEKEHRIREGWLKGTTN